MAKRSIIPLFIPHAGCPQACVFCDQRKISGAATPVTPEEVEKTIRESLAFTGPGAEAAFYGGSFTALPERVQRDLLGAARPFFEQGALRSIRLSTRPDAVDEDTCMLLREYGVETVELGCQSMDDRVLTLSKRGHSAADTVRAAQLLRAGGFQLILQMMTGLPGDDGSASLETARRIIALRPDGVRIYPTVVLKGTELAKMAEQGTYRPQTVEQAVDLCATLYEEFRRAGIPVIRLGLNPTQELAEQVLAGAYHPALGELVLGEMYCRRALSLLDQAGPTEAAVLRVHRGRVSVMAGQKKKNLLRLRDAFPHTAFRIREGEEDLWGLTLITGDGQTLYSP